MTQNNDLHIYICNCSQTGPDWIKARWWNPLQTWQCTDGRNFHLVSNAIIYTLLCLSYEPVLISWFIIYCSFRSYCPDVPSRLASVPPVYVTQCNLISHSAFLASVKQQISVNMFCQQSAYKKTTAPMKMYTVLSISIISTNTLLLLAFSLLFRCNLCCLKTLHSTMDLPLLSTCSPAKLTSLLFWIRCFYFCNSTWELWFHLSSLYNSVCFIVIIV